MKKIFFVALTIVIFSSSQIFAELSSDDILKKVDDVVNAPNDQIMTIKIIIIDKNGKEKIREISMFQKGSDKRIAKFISPADQKGIGFLSLPNSVMYIYLPAFKKVRRIASHIKNTKFAGTDFTYEDMEAKKYSEKWNPKLIKTEDNYYILELNPKKNNDSDYSKIILWVRKDIFFPVKIEYYDKNDKLCKIMVRNQVEKIDGYWTAKESIMEDFKTQNKTKMILENVKFDTKLSDDIFTERYLTR